MKINHSSETDYNKKKKTDLNWKQNKFSFIKRSQMSRQEENTYKEITVTLTERKPVFLVASGFEVQTLANRTFRDYCN